MNKRAAWVVIILYTFIITQVINCKTILNDTIHVFYNFNTPQHEFAAGDIKSALESRGYSVSLEDISSLDSNYEGMKIVLSLENNSNVISLLLAQGGSSTDDLGEQAYALRTTITSQMSYWVIGGDDNGAMYGGIQLSEYIHDNGLKGNYNETDSPYLKKRGIKYNIPLDKNAPTYAYSNGGTSHKNAIKHVWDITFWQDYFDEMARNRYNVLSLWNPHPFTSMLNMEDEYPGIAIENIEGYNGFAKSMTIEEKIKFWQDVMAYAHNRGFEIYFCTWNIFLWNAEGKYGLTDDYHADQSATIAYLKKCMINFLETYPDLDGFGVTAGENLKYDDNTRKIDWTWNAYGEGFKEFAETNPQRELTFFHRQHQGNVSDIIEKFNPLYVLDNVTLDVSFKYAKAHVHSTTTPDHWSNRFLERIDEKGLKTWLELRNDDFYFLHWGDHQFVRDFVKAMPAEKLLAGTFFGSDGWVFTRVFTSKNPYYENNNTLEVQKHWYLYKLWGRLQYNPNTSVNLFINHMQYKYQVASADLLFEAWTKASRAMQLANEQVGGSGHPDQDNISRHLDFQWWPEFYTRYNGFITLEKAQYAGPMTGSKLCSIYETAEGKCGDKISAYETADSIESYANKALKLLQSLEVTDTELLLLIDDLKAMSNLSLYNAYKNRAAIYLKQGKQQKSMKAIGIAYCFWEKYTNIMDSLYYPVDTQRNWDFADSDWHDMDDEALEDYTDFGRNRKPNCSGQNPWLDFVLPSDKSSHINPSEINVELVVEPGNEPVEMVDLISNGDLIGSESDFPYKFTISNPDIGEYNLEAKVYDSNGDIDVTSIDINVFDSASYNSVSWTEDFNLEKRAMSDNGVTSWSCERVNGRFSVIDEILILNDNGSEGVMKTGKINISKGTVDISLEVNSRGDLENDDYARLYKIVDGGNEQLVGEIRGAINKSTKILGEAEGKTLRLVIRSDVNASTRYYFFDNLSVTYKEIGGR